MKTRMKMVCTALAVVGLASGAMAGRGSRRPIEKRTGSQEQFGSGTAEEFCRRGDRLYYGRGCERDLEAAAEQYWKAAEMGCARAEDALSSCYHNGHGVERNMELAVAWCEQAAGHGYARSMFRMGIYRHSGMGGVTNAAEACQWFRLAAQNGIGDPNFDSGLDESEGCGQEASLAWIVNRALSGDAYAIYWYSWCLASGWGVRRDVAAAQEILVALASRGYSLAKCMVGRDKWYGRLPGGQEEGLELVQEAEKQGNATAYLYLENLEQTGGL